MGGEGERERGMDGCGKEGGMRKLDRGGREEEEWKRKGRIKLTCNTIVPVNYQTKSFY